MYVDWRALPGIIVVAGLIAACGSDGPPADAEGAEEEVIVEGKAGKAPEIREPELPAEARLFVESAEVPTLNCPDETTRAGTPPGEQWCEQAGLRQGPYYMTHPGGKRAIVGGYDGGRMTGQWSRWFPSGQMENMGRYDAGKQQGSWTWWFDNGNRQIKGDYLNGRRAGIWTEWHRNGERQSEGRYVNDRREGQWQYWDEQGQAAKTETWQADKLIETIEVEKEGEEGADEG